MLLALLQNAECDCKSRLLGLRRYQPVVFRRLMTISCPARAALELRFEPSSLLLLSRVEPIPRLAYGPTRRKLRVATCDTTLRLAPARLARFLTRTTAKAALNPFSLAGINLFPFHVTVCLCVCVGTSQKSFRRKAPRRRLESQKPSSCPSD